MKRLKPKIKSSIEARRKKTTEKPKPFCMKRIRKARRRAVQNPGLERKKR
jgi:hypothetical protein